MFTVPKFQGNVDPTKTFEGKTPLKYPRFCNSNCKSGLRADRRAGLIYPLCGIELDDGTHVRLSTEDASRYTRKCAYCDAHTTNR